MEVARSADAGLDFHSLAILEMLRLTVVGRRRMVVIERRTLVFERKAHARPRALIQLQRKLLAVVRESRGLDHAPR